MPRSKFYGAWITFLILLCNSTFTALRLLSVVSAVHLNRQPVNCKGLNAIALHSSKGLWRRPDLNQYNGNHWISNPVKSRVPNSLVASTNSATSPNLAYATLDVGLYTSPFRGFRQKNKNSKTGFHRNAVLFSGISNSGNIAIVSGSGIEPLSREKQSRVYPLTSHPFCLHHARCRTLNLT